MALQKILLRVTALVLVAAMAAGLAGCSLVDERYSRRISELEAENATLRSQVDLLSSQLEALQSSILQSWELRPEINGEPTDPVGIWFTAKPELFQPGQSAELVVMLDGREKLTVPCVWDGEVYSTFLTLEPADGYGFYCVLTGSNGRQQRTALSTVEDPAVPALTYMASSLGSYCNLVVDDWKAKKNKLTIVSATGTVQLPLLSASEEEVICTSAQLVLQRNGKTVDTKDVTVVRGETENSFIVIISNVTFTLPDMKDDDQLVLWLDVYLSEGGGLTASGGSWYPNGDGLALVVG